MARQSITPQWSLEDYRDMVSLLVSQGRVISMNEYVAGQSGIFLRHDVELEFEAAEKMAQVEKDVGISATYFICFESPYLSFEEAVSLVSIIRSLGHDIGFHRLWNKEYTTNFRKMVQLTTEEYNRISFHAPSVPICDLAQTKYGVHPYKNMCNKVGQYFSDSTGRWRWGNPLDTKLTKSPIQLLVHPFWWSRSNVDKEIILNEKCKFLPQIVRGG